MKIYAQVLNLRQCRKDLLWLKCLQKKVYSEIVKETGASTATISRVKRALFDNDTYGYTLVLDKIAKEENK